MRRDPVYTARARELRANANDAERRMWSILRAKRMGGYKFRRQHALGRHIADFVCLGARLVIEVDGDSHGDDESELRDATRTRFIESLGFRVIRFWNHEVLMAADDVEGVIAHELGMTSDSNSGPLSLTLSPPGRGECKVLSPAGRVGLHGPSP